MPHWSVFTWICFAAVVIGLGLVWYANSGRAGR